MVVRQQDHSAGVSKMNVSDFFQNIINSNINSSSKLTLLHINNTKVFCVPCISCSQSPKPIQRAFIIFCRHMHEKNIKFDPALPVPEPATSYVGKQEQEEESFEVNSSRKRLSKKERDDFIIKESDIDKTQHSQTGKVNLTAERQKRKKQISFTKINNRSNNLIGLEDLQIHFGKRRKEAAKSLGVSVSTLKRIARQHGIASWPYSKINKNKGATHSQFSQTCLNTERPIHKFPESKEFAITRRPETAMNDLTTKSVKVKFGNDVIRFEISTLSKMVDLEDEMTKRLKLEMGSFTIKYMDEDRDLVLITCDADLSYCMRSSGKTPIRMVVNLIISLPPP